ncbi:1,4-dihydroxy-6-naphthoate synthase [Chitinophagaceae bacterium LB-8]|uniref:1,4-dihydroxy-6-naphtoate synthase n=1 Tax=Paraflavisolibacter caeni TaxID=2982496 RepID=A0A9X2XTM7_9BACT|nr:1,4-dihydroxy-6-naphthoate synthase [Paraflavisolibacter caeni]MCU7548395.1 1,4-dihydroxy-6-naphthoate synthase [Paraflavisolibacter caeni]
MKLRLGFSPCPNDTFIFDALVNHKIDTDGLEFEVYLEDVETLNQWAIEGRLDATKLSFPALFRNVSQYTILSSGSALGKGVGPLLISKEEVETKEVSNLSIAIPGENTTANFLLSFAFPQAQNRTPTLFSSIEDSVLQGKTDLGLIIHENRFTYQQKGLNKVLDLGAYWESKTGLPIPLGCIAVKRSIHPVIQQKLDVLIRKSLEYAFSHYPEISAYVETHAQAMDKSVMRQHIDLYVNNFSLQLGEEGEAAITQLYKVYMGQWEGKLFLG